MLTYVLSHPWLTLFFVWACCGFIAVIDGLRLLKSKVEYHLTMKEAEKAGDYTHKRFMEKAFEGEEPERSLFLMQRFITGIAIVPFIVIKFLCLVLIQIISAILRPQRFLRKLKKSLP